VIGDRGKSNESLGKLLSSARDGCFAECGDTESELNLQRRSLLNLEARTRANDSSIRYLATYDSIMRLVEIWRLQFGYRLGRHPHQGMIATATLLAPRIQRDEVRALVDARHRLKKDGVRPAEDLQQLLCDLHLQLQEQVIP